MQENEKLGLLPASWPFEKRWKVRRASLAPSQAQPSYSILNPKCLMTGEKDSEK